MRRKTNRPFVLTLLMLAAGIMAAFTLEQASSPALAQTGLPEASNGRTPTLTDRLVFGLQARRPSEIEFVTAVVDTVERGELPLKLVDRTFFWARENTRRRGGRRLRRPIIYFEPALIRLADRYRIAIRRDAAP